MPVDKQVIERYRVLNECFRNPYRDYTIDDLVDECNKALRRLDKPEVSKRTVQLYPHQAPPPISAHHRRGRRLCHHLHQCEGKQ